MGRVNKSVQIPPRPHLEKGGINREHSSHLFSLPANVEMREGLFCHVLPPFKKRGGRGDFCSPLFPDGRNGHREEGEKRSSAFFNGMLNGVSTLPLCKRGNEGDLSFIVGPACLSIIGYSCIAQDDKSQVGIAHVIVTPSCRKKKIDRVTFWRSAS